MSVTLVAGPDAALVVVVFSIPLWKTLFDEESEYDVEMANDVISHPFAKNRLEDLNP
jgi:hypothetical protein